MAPKIDVSKLKTLKEELWDMPMFHMMLGGRELFHSNVLGWIFEKHTVCISSFFGLSPERLHVQREKHNLDLIVTCGNKCILIENKFKAVIREDQLDEYLDKISGKTDFNKKDKNFIILSPDEFEIAQKIVKGLQKFQVNQWQKNDKEWYHLSYRDLFKHLEKADDRYIVDYVKMTNKVLDFTESAIANDRDHDRVYWFDVKGQFKEQDEIARKLKLQDMLQKRRAEKLQKDLWGALKEQSLDVQKEDVRTDFMRTEPLAEAFIHLDDSLSIGVQIQGHAYKRCLLINRVLAKKKNGYDSRMAEGLKKKTEEFTKNGWFRFKDEKVFSRRNAADRPASAEKTKAFQKYGNNFLYQYVKVGVNGLSPQELIEAVVEDLKFARELIKASSPTASSS